MEPVPWPVAAAVAIALVGAVGALWRAHVNGQRDARAREAAAATRCEREISQAVQRIQFLENRAHSEQREVITASMNIIKTNSETLGRLVELEKTRQTASGSHPTQNR